jgi:hypothetical protein
MNDYGLKGSNDEISGDPNLGRFAGIGVLATAPEILPLKLLK